MSEQHPSGATDSGATDAADTDAADAPDGTHGTETPDGTDGESAEGLMAQVGKGFDDALGGPETDDPTGSAKGASATP